jgi:hypothetical protein
LLQDRFFALPRKSLKLWSLLKRLDGRPLGILPTGTNKRSLSRQCIGAGLHKWGHQFLNSIKLTALFSNASISGSRLGVCRSFCGFRLHHPTDHS